MKYFLLLAFVFGMIFSQSHAASVKSPLEFTLKSIDGKDVALESFKGKVVMMVNVASKCGLTPQYEQLQAVYEKYKDQGFVILGFPANNFLKQEPGTDAQIKEFCSLNYGVTFPMFSKISVKGKDQHPLYQYLTDKKAHEFGGEIKWNFQKFIVDKEGNLVARFTPKTKPDAPEVIKVIKTELAK